MVTFLLVMIVMVIIMMVLVMAFFVVVFAPVPEMFENTVGSFFPLVVVAVLSGIAKAPLIVMSVFGVMTVHMMMRVFA